ncbi:MAG: nucleoside deaminase [Bacteroidetes bacterium]|nr:nucleoside deaminase [Bacteroidota bacterium]MBU1718234.1 nucleoside deaminase [Bacteroidota bacterium]
MLTDEHFMLEALKEARFAASIEEVPIGAVIVVNERIIARAHNLCETLHDSTAHAEMQAFTSASEYMGSKYLNDCTLYVTVEPCPMCAGAAFWTRIGRIVWGADDPKRGFTRFSEKLIHPSCSTTSGVLADEAGNLMSEFFQKKRN